MRTHGKVDANHTEIVQALRDIGASVQSLASLGNGCPDILVGWMGNNYLMEIKSPGGKLTPDESEWDRMWQGDNSIVYSIDDALTIIGAI
jgi:hypothetical protein